ncbi:hypothetical protein AWE51_00090 [Aquimarina aggregata]|uniref:Uncharacterized protein n=1 Tax=Aquimarina aggregata TaxID=1642818 RepID=A0A163BXP1_9FLAO|nr:hypothetical protein [Aquimarina aggregata]KZS41880.1 hypothetical protein AWE51_00090 [Aquimarina aggregata]
MTKENKIEYRKMIAIICTAFIVLVFIVMDGVLADKEIRTGCVVYKPDIKHHANFKITHMSNSNSTLAITYLEGHQQKFVLKIKTTTGQILTIETPKDIYMLKSKSDTIEYVQNKGYFTGLTWDTNALK